MACWTLMTLSWQSWSSSSAVTPGFTCGRITCSTSAARRPATRIFSISSAVLMDTLIKYAAYIREWRADRAPSLIYQGQDITVIGPPVSAIAGPGRIQWRCGACHPSDKGCWAHKFVRSPCRRGRFFFCGGGLVFGIKRAGSETSCDAVCASSPSGIIQLRTNDGRGGRLIIAGSSATHFCPRRNSHIHRHMHPGARRAGWCMGCMEVQPHSGAFYGQCFHASDARGGRPLRSSDPLLASQDGPLHLRGPQQDPHHQSRKDPAPL